MKVLLLVVTMSGTSEMIAEDIAEAYGSDYEFDLQLVENTEPAILTSVRHLILISSTYGTGDIPDPGQPFFNALESSELDLSHLHYGVISLGDTIYADTFANGGKQWHELLKQHQANPVTEPLLLDASGTDDMSEVAVEWGSGCIASLKSVATV